MSKLTELTYAAQAIRNRLDTLEYNRPRTAFTGFGNTTPAYDAYIAKRNALREDLKLAEAREAAELANRPDVA